MSVPLSPQRPAWQTDELEDEWIDDDEQDHHPVDDTFSSFSQGTRSISMTTPLTGLLRVINTTDDPADDQREHTTTTTTTASQAGGTFLVREDVPAVPLLPQTPGRNNNNNNKGMIKDFFSPLQLERMFEPPSPPPKAVPTVITKPNQPAVSSRLAREYLPHLQESEVEVEDSEVDREPVDGVAFNSQFTFTAPRNDTQSPPNGGLPQAQKYAFTLHTPAYYYYHGFSRCTPNAGPPSEALPIPVRHVHARLLTSPPS